MPLQALKIDIPKDLHKRLKIRSVVEEKTMAQLVAKIIQDYLDKTEPEAKAKDKQK